MTRYNCWSEIFGAAFEPWLHAALVATVLSVVEGEASLVAVAVLLGEVCFVGEADFKTPASFAIANFFVSGVELSVDVVDALGIEIFFTGETDFETFATLTDESLFVPTGVR